MPHKRAKRSIREQLRNKKCEIFSCIVWFLILSFLRGSDLAPAKQSLSNEAIPKSLARVLNASQIREDFKKRKLTTNDALGTNRAEKRRKVDESGLGKSQPKQKANKEEANVAGLTIKPGESIGHFNRYVVSCDLLLGILVLIKPTADEWKTICDPSSSPQCKHLWLSLVACEKQRWRPKL